MAKPIDSKFLVYPVALIVVVALLILYTLSQSQMTPVNQQISVWPQTTQTIDVNGQATMTISPDKADIALGYDVIKETAEESQQESARVIEAVRNALVAEGLSRDKIETSSYNVVPIRKWSDEKAEYVFVGYQTTHILKIETENLDKVGSYIDAAAGAGANYIGSISFGLKKETEKEIINQAIYEASTNAKDKAEVIARGLGVQITKVYRSSEGYSYVPRTYDYGYAESASMDSAMYKTEITPGEVEVQASVSVSYSFR